MEKVLNIYVWRKMMIKNYKVITLCGSTKFKEEFMNVQKDLTLKGNIIDIKENILIVIFYK